MNNLVNKRIIVGITGGIAAYKSAELVRKLSEAGAQVRVVMTTAAKAFITPLTLQALSGNPVHHDLFDETAEAAMGHIELARWAEAVIVAPASANFIAKLAHGQADDLLSTLCLATQAKIAIAPAMNQQMWQNPAVQANLALLKKRYIHQFGPAAGVQACGEVGFGRLLEPLELVAEIKNLFISGALAGKKVVLTAGPTQEAIDPVRFLTNHSSGKMGYALAQALAEAGASVTLISGPVALDCPVGVKRIAVVSAAEMHSEVLGALDGCDIFIATAAVADYRCQQIATQKIKKNGQSLTLQLTPNPDIVAAVAKLAKRPFTIGFAAETENVIINAKEKLQAKQLDMIVANQVGQPETGFGSDENALTVIWPTGQQVLPRASKTQLARELVKLIAECSVGLQSNRSVAVIASAATTLSTSRGLSAGSSDLN